MDVCVTERIRRRKYLRREMAELCSALIRAATEFSRDRETKIITDVSVGETVGLPTKELTFETNELHRSARHVRVGPSKTRDCSQWRIIRKN